MKTNVAPALGARLATTSALDGKIHQVIGAVVDGMSRLLHIPIVSFGLYVCLRHLRQSHIDFRYQLVKFDTDTLPPILNALVTENHGQKLVLEVAVSFTHGTDLTTKS